MEALLAAFTPDLLSESIIKLVKDSPSLLIAILLVRYVKDDIGKQMSLLKQSLDHGFEVIGKRLDTQDERLDKLEGK